MATILGDILRTFYKLNILGRLLRLTWVVLTYYGFHQKRKAFRSSKTVPSKSSYSSSDVTIVCPVVDPDEDFVTAMNSWLRSDPHSIILVTTFQWLDSVNDIIQQFDDPRISVYAIEKKGKRYGLMEGIRLTTTPLIVLLDDDIVWLPFTLQGILCGLSASPEVGGVFPGIRLNPRRISSSSPEHACTVFETMGASRHDRRALTNAAMAYFCDGQVLTCSGRTSAYRTKILHHPDFEKHFIEDYWRKKYLLTSGDDRAITRWLYLNGWKTEFLSADECAIISRPKRNSDYLLQLLRWSRSEVRQVLRDLDHISPWSQSHQKRLWFSSFIFPVMMEDHLLLLDFITTSVIVICQSISSSVISATGIPGNFHLVSQYFWMSACLELLFNCWHLTKYPEHIKNIPVLAIWGHVRMFVTTYAFLTTHNSSWLTRSGAS